MGDSAECLNCHDWEEIGALDLALLIGWRGRQCSYSTGEPSAKQEEGQCLSESNEILLLIGMSTSDTQEKKLIRNADLAYLEQKANVNLI